MTRRMRRMVRKVTRWYELMCDPYYYPEWWNEAGIFGMGMLAGVILVIVLMRVTGHWV